MHPKEAKRQRTGTGRLAHLSLPGSEVLIGLDFTHDVRLHILLEDPRYFPVLLYPGRDAWTSASPGFAAAVGKRTLLVLVVDATWFCSRKILEHSPWLLDLPRLSFSGMYRSIFTFKREPRPEYISTIESCYYLIREMQAISLADTAADPEPLMDIFRRMIRFQLEAENERISGERPGTHAYDWKYSKKKEVTV
jgi:DTW domain-containing protein YfiP